MKNYELLTILKPSLDGEEVDKVLAKLDEALVELGGKLVSREKTGRRKLAYEIQKFRDGFFVNQVVAVPAEQVAEYRRQLKLNDNVLRTMLLEQTKVAQKA